MNLQGKNDRADVVLLRCSAGLGSGWYVHGFVVPAGAVPDVLDHADLHWEDVHHGLPGWVPCLATFALIQSACFRRRCLVAETREFATGSFCHASSRGLSAAL